MIKQTSTYDRLGRSYLLQLALCSLFSDRVVEAEAVLESLQKINTVLRYS